MRRPKLCGFQKANMLREGLAVPAKIPKCFIAAMNLRPREESIDDVSDAHVGLIETSRLHRLELVELLLSEFLVPLPRGEPKLLAAHRHHPPADVLSKPDLVRSPHGAPPVKEPWNRP